MRLAIVIAIDALEDLVNVSAAAIDSVHDGAFGQMVALRCGKVVRVPLRDATDELKLVDEELYDVAKVFFG